jgi:hypothetical protein
VATQQEITDAVDAGIAAVWSEIESKQEAYLVANGRYFQGLCTHSTLPADGNPAPADQLSDHPDYQAESWLDVGYDDAAPLAALAIDQYDGDDGPGYVCRFSLTIDGVLWQRSINVGPATYFEQPWQAIGTSSQ